jgi:hypothetical protein
MRNGKPAVDRQVTGVNPAGKKQLFVGLEN